MEKRIKRIVLLPVCLFLMASLMVITIGKEMRTVTGREDDDLQCLCSGWYYMENGEKVSVELPFVWKTSGQETAELYRDTSLNQVGDTTVMTKGAQYQLEILWDGEEIYRYEEHGFERNFPMARKLECRAAIPTDSQEGQLTLRFQVPKNGKLEIEPVYIGSSETIFRYQMFQAATVFVIVLVMLVLSLIAAGIYAYLRYKRIPECRFANVALFLLFCGIWCMTDSSIVQYLGNYAPIINQISFYAFMLMAVPVIHFVQATGTMEKYKRIDVLILLFYLNVSGQSLANICFGISMVDMLWITHLLLLIGCVELMILLYRECRRERNKEIDSILAAFGVLTSSGVFALLLYWAFGITDYDLIFEFGIIIFVWILLARLGITMVDNMRYRTEAEIYRKLSREDQLTGMKNRMAFEKMVKELEEEKYDWKNPVLVFMDLNHLKYTNDFYGHSAGDELIIATAQCIEKAYGSLGHCFRIGGDEFCAILPDTAQEERELNQRLDEAIEEYNRFNVYRLSIARGFSWLNDEKGVRKSISDWKSEADQKMYLNKGWYKRGE